MKEITQWQDIKERIKSVLLTIKKDPLTNDLIKTSLSSIPGIGPFLSVIYDNSLIPPDEKTEQVLRLLENLQNLSEKEYESLSEMIKNNGVQLIENTKSLENLIQKIDIFKGYFSIIEKNQLEEIMLSSQTFEKNKRSGKELNRQI